jgi:hypothetical protein
LRTFRGQLNGHVIADRDTHAAQALRGQGHHPSAAARHKRWCGSGSRRSCRRRDGRP